MALPRRTLPSRQPSASTAGGAVAAPAKPVESAPAEAAAPSAPQGPQTLAVPAIPATSVPVVADNPFSTLPSAPARVLEDSFQSAPVRVPEAAPAAPIVVEPSPFDRPAPVETKTAEPAPAEIAPVPAPLPPLEAPSSPSLPAGFGEEAPAPSIAPLPQAITPAPLPAAVPGWGVAEAEAAPAPVTFSAPAETAPAPVAAPVASAPAASAEPSRPDENGVRRRVREKRPRDFSAVAAVAPVEPAKPSASMESKVPVNTQPLDRVDEKLISTGIIAPPPADSLTSSVPGSLAESESSMPPMATSASVAVPQPAPVPVPLPPLATPPASASPARPVEDKPATPAAVAAPVPAPQPAPAAIPAPAAAAPQAPEAPVPAPSAFTLSKAAAPVSEPLPPPQSDLPWASAPANAEWELEIPEAPSWSHEGTHESTAAAPAPSDLPPPPADLYRPREAPASGGVPPWQSGAAPRSTPVLPPPELPRNAARKSGFGMSTALVVVGLLAAIGGGVYLLKPSNQQGKFQEQMARLTGTLQDQSEALPGVSGTAPTGPLLKPESTFNMAQFGPGVLLPPSATTPPVVAGVAGAPAGMAAPVSGTAIVDFADIPADQARQPITADGTEKMPEDISFMARLQKEIKVARAEKEGREADKVSGTAPDVAAKDDNTPYTPEKLKAELDAYRRALAESPTPGNLKPAEFLRDPDGYMDGKTMGQQQAAASVSGTSGSLLPPPTAAQQAAALPPPELYTNNPKNLPIVAEPSAAAPQRVRTLADFGVEAFEPERPKVEIPKGIKPRMAATDFPGLEILSFVPGRGVVAYADGREGVLLLGESINGWELTSVAPDHAEFKAGRKTYQVTADAN